MGKCPLHLMLKHLLFQELCRHMRIHLAFLGGWLVSLLGREKQPDLQFLITHTNLLKEEIRAAREAVDLLTDIRGTCEWELWVSKWALRVSFFFDVVLILVVVWVRQFSRPRVVPLPAIQAETGGSSSDTDEVPSTATTGGIGPLRAIGKGTWVRNRPTRPSDLKGGK